ncbi:hypothetical protein GN958_ATG23402 [Phytophthora infestans]|uniref:Uncharacterized protein n=1 Tax=Phytophthora infestans TaxID=4787 RepID=A0A8S9TJ37_PHYIN|nr:hypothetical protein GN958_ATG23402 [Phytophthora infestans]
MSAAGGYNVIGLASSEASSSEEQNIDAIELAVSSKKDNSRDNKGKRKEINKTQKPESPRMLGFRYRHL